MKEHIIIITNNSNKHELLRLISQNKLFYNLKFFTFGELKKKLFFDYNNETLAYIINNYQVNIDIAKEYLESMYFLRPLKDEKVEFLLSLKADLEKQNLLLKSPHFLDIFQNKKVVVYGYPNLTKEQELILSCLKNPITNYATKNTSYQHTVYECDSSNQEVEFVANQISALIAKKVPISNIKIIASEEYYDLLKRYFYLYDIPINLRASNSLYATLLAQDFLKNYDTMSLNGNLAFLSEKYSNVNDLIRVLNKSALISDKNTRLTFIIHDLKNTPIPVLKYENALELASINSSFSSEDHVFLLGFNVNAYPKVKKDDAYLSDIIKEKLGLDTSSDLNRLETKNLTRIITSIANLTITYKKVSKTGVFYPSSLIKDLALEVKPAFFNPQISYSKLNTSLKYAHDLDNLLKFNVKSPELALYRHNLNIPYREYNNEFSGINKEALKEKLSHNLVLAYTTLEMYNECAFKYYLSKILNLNPYEETFKTIIGNVVHHILELSLTKDVNIPFEISAYLKAKEYSLNAKEYFYLEKLSSELQDIIAIIKEQMSHSKLTNLLFESELYVQEDIEDYLVTFKGLIDKVMYQNINNKEVLAVVDYKTGYPKVTLDTLKYGLNMQLPIYLYLLKKSERFKSAQLAGFYIQKVLDNVPNIDPKKDLLTIKKENMRLQGFSNEDPEILELISDEYLDSQIIKNLKYKRDGSISAKSKVLTNEQMEDLTKEVALKIHECITNIIEAKFPINPKVLQGKNIACEHCSYQSICFMSKKDEQKIGDEEENEMDA